ncbi:ABC-2 type transport system permease protein [Microbacterium azadirachtae]|uniref:Transport permease protein n=1 Tax=Microbacterium azadirachtae TaxID=582680 RepID=A0A1I6J621_9MICO|nr:ABC transporter permease [Microbacterium azadirachtae]SFR74424.1 ABC-2 type transport system permease protein [Microbacterium azadirachtae]
MTVLSAPSTPRPPARVAAAASGIRPRLRGIAAERVFVRRSLTLSLRDGETLSMSIMLPVTLMLLFTFVFGGAIEKDGSYVDYVVPGIILLCAGFGAASTATYVSRDMSTGIVDRIRTMPLRPGSVLTGHVIASLVRNLVSTAVVFGVALLVGFRPSAGPLQWVAAFGVIAVYILVITYLYAAIGLAAGSPEAAAGYGFILMFVPYLSSAFVPVDTMPAWLQWIAENQPITPIIETIRGLLMDRPLDAQPYWALGWCALILVVSVLWGRWLFGRARH